MSPDNRPPPLPADLTLMERLAEGWRLHRRQAFFVGGAVLTVLTIAWLADRWSHVSENDARVRADMIAVASRVDGWVAERPVTDGQTIARDQELVVIDQRESRLKLAQLAARAEAVRIRTERTRTELAMKQATAPDAVRAADARRAAAEARHRAAVTQLGQARRDFERADALVERIVSRELRDQRQTQLRQAEDAEKSAAADLAGADAALADARARLAEIDLLRRDLDGLTQEAAAIAAEIGQRQIDMTDRQVKSPIDGIVDEKFVQPGEYVVPGQRLFVIHDPKSVWIEADIKETKLAGLHPGQPVEITVDAYPDRHFEGRIERIGNAATSEFALLPSPNPSGNFTKITQRVPVRIKVVQPADNPLRPGMMVEVDIDTARHAQGSPS